MASTSSTSGVSNGRYWGLASGLNVDSIVTGLLSDEQAKIDKAQQSEQKLEWKQSAYRDIIDKLNNFQSAYLEFGTATSMASTNMYTSYTPSSSEDSLVTATATSDATGAAKTIKIVQSATTAALTGTNVGSSGLTSSKNWSDTLNILKNFAAAFEGASPAIDDPSFSVTVDGVTKSISFTAAELNNVTSASAGSGPTDTTNTTGFANLINKKLATAFGAVSSVDGSTTGCKVVASIDSTTNELTFSSNSALGYTSTISVASTPPAFSMNTVGAYVTAAAASGTTAPSMTVKYGDSAAQTMTFTAGNDNLAGIQSWLDTNYSGKGLTASVDATSGAISIKDASGKAASVSTSTGYNAVDALGLTNGANNRLNINSNLGTFLTSKNIHPTEDTDGNFNININGTAVKLNANTMSISDAISAINGSSAGVKMAYDSTTDTVSLTANQSGTAGSINLSNSSVGTTSCADTTNFFTALGILTTSALGQDAIVNINGTNFTRPSNKFTIDGVTYSINKTVTPASTDNTATLTFAQDTSALKTGIQNFVSAYNSLITDINAQIDTVPDSDYPPLTDAQKAQMTNDQINSWNQKAQAGMLNNDDTLQGICDSMRSLLDKSVTLSDGSKYSLYDMGITTSDDAYANGKLEIKTTDETKFANAIATQSSKIMELFTKTSDTLLNISPKTTDEYNTQVNRKNEEGLAHRLDDVISAATANVYGTYGSLLQIAGTTTTLTYQNTLYDQLKDVKSDITDLKSQMTDKKNRLYSEFENLETYMEQANAQSSMISSMGKS